MEDKINIVFVTDDNYFKHMFIAMESIIKNTDKSSEINFYILDLGITNNNKFKLKKRYKNYNNIDVEFVEVKNRNLQKYKTRNHISSAAYAKIYICDLIRLDRAIYLDCDLILNTDIAELWNEFEIGCCIKAVWNPFYDYDNKYLGIKDGKRTFNSGVMLMNLDLMRKKESSKKLESFLNDFHDKTKLHDQAAFNAVFKDDWRELDLVWNCQVSMLQNDRKKLNISKEKYIQLYRNPKIIHFTSNSKPWQFRNGHPHKKVYQKYYKEIFGDIEYNDISIKSFLQVIREVLRYKYYYILNTKIY